MHDPAKLEEMRTRFRLHSERRSAFLEKLKKMEADGLELDEQTRAEAIEIITDPDRILFEFGMVKDRIDDDSLMEVSTPQQIGEFWRQHNPSFGADPAKHGKFTMSTELVSADDLNSTKPIRKIDHIAVWKCECGAGIRFENKSRVNHLTLGEQGIRLAYEKETS